MSFSDSRNGMLLSQVCRASRARPILPAQRWVEANEKYSGYQQIRRSTRTIFSDSVDYEQRTGHQQEN